MELSWTTFFLEIINFLVLIWILKRFLYKPVLEVIARRRERIEKTMADAEAMRSDAEKLQQKYESRLEDWDKERLEARESLQNELEQERCRRMEELQGILEQEREKAQVAENKRQTDAMRKMEASALRQGARFAALLLKEASGPETEARFVELLVSHLSQLPPERIAMLHTSYGEEPESIEVTSAYPLTDEQRQQLEEVLTYISTPDTVIHYTQNSELIAGTRITIGAWVLAANIQDELKGFTEIAENA